jgi:hypothetical protein
MSPETEQPFHIVDTQTAAPQQEENPGTDLLRAAGFPFNPSHLPNVRLDGENVVFTITTPESLSSQEWREPTEFCQNYNHRTSESIRACDNRRHYDKS